MKKKSRIFFVTLVFFSLVFIYSMPGYKCSVKERMLYSTCKAPLLAGLEEELKIEIPKKVKLHSLNDVHAEIY